MAVTINDVAQEAGVNKATVSLVLNGKWAKARISEGTRQRILDVATRLDYRPSFSARALATGRTFSLGLVCGDIDSPHFSEFTAIALQEASSRGYHLLVSVTEWDQAKELEALDTLMDRRVDGVMMWSAAVQPGTRQYDRIVETGFPTVVFDSGDFDITTIYSDWVPGMEQAIEHLTGKGATHVAYVRQAESGDFIGKRKAFFDVCKQQGVEAVEYDCAADIDAAVELGRTLAGTDHPRAIIAFSDWIAMGLIRGFRDRGLDVPRDVAVVGIDGTRAGRMYCPSLTSIMQDRPKMAHLALDLLEEQIDSGQIPANRHGVPTRLVLGESA